VRVKDEGPANSDRVFSVEELRVASMRSVDAFAEALAHKDDARAGEFSKRLRYETLAMLRSYDAWEDDLIAWVARREEAATVEALRSQLNDRLKGQCPEPIAEEPESHLREIARSVMAALDAGNRELALVQANKLHDDALNHHDRGMARVTGILSWIGNRYEATLLEEAMTESMAGDLLGDVSFREQAEALMHYTRVHLHPFELEEDDEKITFTCPVCPSGGRLLQNGHYADSNLGMELQGPRPFTYGRESLPVYCCHEPAIEIASIQKTGVPMFIVEPSDELGVKPCKTYLYKNSAGIPERFYTRLGLEKPSSKPS